MSVNAPNNSPVNLATYLNYLGSATFHDADTDLASSVIAEQLKAKDSTVKRMLQDIRLVAKARTMISKRLAKLRNALAEVKSADANPDGKMNVKITTNLKDEERNQLDLRFDYEKGKVEEKSGPMLKGEAWSHGTGRLKVDGNTLEAEIKRLEGVAQQLDSDREVRMIQLNSQMSKRGNMLQMLSNITKKTNDTKNALISNMR